MKKLLPLFLTSYTQVALVCCNTWLISHEQYVGVFLVSYGISHLWAVNVKKVTVGSTVERVAYASGAAFGGLSGLLIAKFILVLL